MKNHLARTHRSFPAVALAAAIAVLSAATPARAETAIGLRAGTPGAGVELTTRLASRIDLRLALAGWDQDLTVTTDDVRYDGTLELRHALALLDWHPTDGAFRLTAGVAFNEDALDATAPVADLVADEVPELPPGLELGMLRGHAEGEQVAPYLGLGWGNPLGGRGWSLSLDLGAILLGSPDVSLELDTPLPIEQVPGLPELVEAAIAAEEAELEEEIGDYDLLPVLSLSVGYRF
jgi:hypothetical protein